MKAFATILLTAICTWLLIGFVPIDVLNGVLEGKTPEEEVLPKDKGETWIFRVGEIDEEKLECYLLVAINQYRIQEGVIGIPTSKYWQKKAKEHSQWMADNGLFEHAGLNNYENLFLYTGYESEETICQKALDRWGTSAGHNANLLNRSLNSCGIGVVQDGTCTYVTFMAD